MADIPIVLYPGLRIVHLCLAGVAQLADGTREVKYSPTVGLGLSHGLLSIDPDFLKIRELIERRSQDIEPICERRPGLHELLYALIKAQPAVKGEALEQFALRLFNNIKGLHIIKKNARLRAEELDLLISNDITEGFWRFAGSPIVVECKNWARSVGAREIGIVSDKLASISPDAKTGIILAPNGVSGTPERDALLKIREKRQHGQYIIVLDRAALEEIATSGRASPVIERKYNELLLI